jgi:hypothetical protein
MADDKREFYDYETARLFPLEPFTHYNNKYIVHSIVFEFPLSILLILSHYLLLCIYSNQMFLPKSKFHSCMTKLIDLALSAGQQTSHANLSTIIIILTVGDRVTGVRSPAETQEFCSTVHRSLVDPRKECESCGNARFLERK